MTRDRLPARVAWRTTILMRGGRDDDGCGGNRRGGDGRRRGKDYGPDRTKAHGRVKRGYIEWGGDRDSVGNAIKVIGSGSGHGRVGGGGGRIGDRFDDWSSFGSNERGSGLLGTLTPFLCSLLQLSAPLQSAV